MKAINRALSGVSAERSAVDDAEKLRAHPELAKRATTESARRKRKKWAMVNQDKMRKYRKEYERRNRDTRRATFAEWRNEHRMYRAAYARRKRFLDRQYPAMGADDRRKKARDYAKREARKFGEQIKKG